jgi:peptide/nickel transport system substrate-binding protein
MMRLTALISLAAAITIAAPATAQKSKDTLRYPIQNSQSTLDSYLAPSSFSNIWEPSVFNNLLGFDPAKGQHTPLLVKSWSQPDPKSYDFELRDDVTWHDGQKFSADDVVYTLNYLIDPAVRLRFKQNWSWLKSVEKLSQTKVRITTDSPIPDGLAWLSFGTPMLPRHLHEPLADKQTFGARPIGTGPYRLVQLDKNTGIVAERYAGFRPGPTNPAPAIGRIVSEPIDDSGALIASLLADRIDAVVDVPVEEALALQKTGRFVVMLAPPRLGYIFMQFPTAAWPKAKPLADVRVRKAIMMAIDRKVLLESVYGELSKDMEPTAALCSKEQLGCGYSMPVPAYDPAAARKLLVEAGYADGFDVTINAYRDNLEDATAISGMVRKIGIRMNVRTIHASNRQKSVNGGDVEVGYFGWSGGNLFAVGPQIVRHFQTGEYQGVDGDIKRLIAPLSTLVDDGARRKATAAAFDFLTENALAYAIVPNREIFTMTKEVGILRPNDLRPSQISPHEFVWK